MRIRGEDCRDRFQPDGTNKAAASLIVPRNGVFPRGKSDDATAK